MDRRTAERLTQLVEGGWSQKMGEAKLAAITEWFQRTEATEDQCRAAIHGLMDSDEYPPTPKKLFDKLKMAGAVGPPVLGVRDPRVMSWLHDSLLLASANTARIRHIDQHEALLLIRDTIKDTLTEVAAMGDGESEELGYWNDRLAAVDALVRERVA